MYEIPAGRLDSGEQPETCAQRELQEETGYTAQRLLKLTTFYTTPGFTDERIHLFAGLALTGGISRPESDEILDLEEVRLSAVMKMIASGEIIDGKSMVGLMFASLFLQQARNSG